MNGKRWRHTRRAATWALLSAASTSDLITADCRVGGGVNTRPWLCVYVGVNVHVCILSMVTFKERQTSQIAGCLSADKGRRREVKRIKGRRGWWRWWVILPHARDGKTTLKTLKGMSFFTAWLLLGLWGRRYCPLSTLSSGRFHFSSFDSL